MKVIPETRRTHLIRDLRFYCYPGSIPLLVPMGIIRPVVAFYVVMLCLCFACVLLCYVYVAMLCLCLAFMLSCNVYVLRLCCHEMFIFAFMLLCYVLLLRHENLQEQGLLLLCSNSVIQYPLESLISGNLLDKQALECMLQ
jgi:predicted membrane metal-binding protein